MVHEQGLYFEPTLRLLICEIHGFGVHPTREAITRHLRGEGHNCRGPKLKEALTRLLQLPLRPFDELLRICQALPITLPITHLKVLRGWACLVHGCDYMTTSFESIKRHVASQHDRCRRGPQSWEICELQTLFAETKDRRYFRTDEPQRKVDAVSPAKHSLMKLYFELKKSKVRVQSQLGQKQVNSSILVAGSLPSKSLGLSSPSPTYYHPFVYIIMDHIPWLSSCRIHELFGSRYFRTASLTIFDPRHIDAERNVQTVFPGCNEEPVFFLALLYSIEVFSSRGATTLVGLMLQKKTIELLNTRLSARSSSVSQPLIGAMMILKTTAYKIQDRDTHDMHSHGLIAALQGGSGDGLSSAARRYGFFQTLFATEFIDTKPQSFLTNLYRCADLFSPLPSHRAKPPLPLGFVRLSHILPQELLSCIVDTLVLQSYQLTRSRVDISLENEILESMQASIESRLVAQRHTCQRLGIIADSTRLAIFLCCYCSWMEIWADCLTPNTLAKHLMNLLESSLSAQAVEYHWIGSLDLLLWVVLVSSSVVELDQDRSIDLQTQRKQVLRLTMEACIGVDGLELQQALQRALIDFVYCEVWVFHRHRVSSWRELEMMIARSQT